MPIITIRQLVGRTPEQKRALAERFTRAVREVYGPTAQPVQVLIEEFPTDDWLSEGVPVKLLPQTYGTRQET